MPVGATESCAELPSLIDAPNGCTVIVRTAGGIDELVHSIWIGGKRIAANTVTIALLGETNDIAGKILGSASEIAKASSRIRQITGGNA